MTPDARVASREIKDNLRAERWRDDVSRGELLDTSARLAALDGEEANDVIASLSDEELARWGSEMHESSWGPFGNDGLDAGERADLFRTLARDIEPEQLARVHVALGSADRRAELVDVIERHAPLDTRDAFFARLGARTIEDGDGQDIGRGELAELERSIERLDGDGVDALFAERSDAELAALGDELFETQTLGVFGDSGYTAAERERLFGTIAAKADAETLARLGTALGPERSAELAAAVARDAPPEVQVGYVGLVAAGRSVPEGSTSSDTSWHSSTWRYADPGARDAAIVLVSLRGEPAADALAALTPGERESVIAAAADVGETMYTTSGAMIAPPTTVSFDEDGFGALVDTFASVPDAALRAELLGEASIALGNLHERHDLRAADRVAGADAIVAALDDDTVASLPPGAHGPLAAALTADERGAPTDAVRALDALAASPSRDALLRTVFAKTPPEAYENDPALAPLMARALVSSTGDALDGPERRAATEALEARLGTERGRALLADQSIDPASRLWAAEQLMADPEGFDALVGDTDKPWESAGLLELHARGRIDQHALARGDAPVTVTGSQVDNYIGASVGAPVREDIPADLDDILPGLEDGSYDAYEGNEAIDRIAGGVRAKQEDWGADSVDIVAVPVQFSSQESGPIDLFVYRIEGPDGQSAIVDNIGRTYDSVEKWLTENELPPGYVTYPEELLLGDGSEAPVLATRVTPNVRDTTWEHIAHWGDIGALALGTVASGVIIFGSGGLATPVVVGAWGVVGASTAWTVGREGAELVDRARHDQSLSLADPDARAAWIGIAAGGLTLAGGGSSLVARYAGNGTRASVGFARASGLFNASANYADAAATLEQTHALVTRWDEMTPAARAQSVLGIAFWGTTTGASLRMNGGRPLDVANGYDVHVQRALIDTGARVTPDAELPSGTASVTPLADGGFAITHAPDASADVVAIHRMAAQELITNGGVEGAMLRLAGAPDAYPPGTFGESVVIEVVKHERLLDAARARADDPSLTATERAAAGELASDYEYALAYHEADLAYIRANPDAAVLAGPDSIDVKWPFRRALGVGEPGLARTAAADLPFTSIVDPDLAARFPDAVPVTLDDLGRGFRYTLSDGTETKKIGGRGSSDLRMALRPVSEGGWDGAVFHDPATDSMIVAVNIRTRANPDTLDRVEIVYAQDANGQWRADFEPLGVYTTGIDPRLDANRPLHFGRANQELAADLANDPALEARLALSPGERTIVDRGLRESPEPYTWHHVDGGGGMVLVDTGIHDFFSHYGGFSEWGR